MLHSPVDSGMESSGAKRNGNRSGVRTSNPGERCRGEMVAKVAKQSNAPKPTRSSMLSARITNLEKKIHTE